MIALKRRPCMQPAARAFKPAAAGCRMPRRPRAGATVQASLATTAAVALAAIPASIAIDGVLDRVTDRVGRVTNAQTASGLRLHVSRPPSNPEAPPAQGKGAPAVVLIHQIFGLQQREVALCNDLARRGYVAVAPDTFDGMSSTWIPRALVIAYPRALKAGAAWGVEAVQDAVEWLKQQPGVDPQRIAVAGFCYGGGSALRYAAKHPGSAKAVGVFYGRPLQEGTAAYAPLSGVPVFGVFGGKDSQFPPAMVDAFESDLSAAGAPHTIKRYPDQGHAFIWDVESTRKPGSDAADAWAAFIKFLGENL